jgi:serine/threonine protein kinase
MTQLDSSLFDEENSSDYCYGGYHPVVIGDVLGGRYEVINKLGYGHYSTVWFCRDKQKNTSSEYVAVKIVKSDPSYTAAAEKEAAFLKRSIFLSLYKIFQFYYSNRK